jgi:hypothetical protein
MPLAGHRVRHGQVIVEVKLGYVVQLGQDVFDANGGGLLGGLGAQRAQLLGDERGSPGAGNACA